ncbi:hydrolase [Polymorphobacter multimanifer]|uniref:Putative amidohydrolase n=1 Tax=Polymorphobacter multimanifer TaxID=1070431 RepID=A0A841L7E0_9SPHN|nr:nitrilase-related carbon-nitrogen hydrolase [Polymorphobacter multimanifer]MBB6228517.1 putative amidohydrolase [Polymorphobacter multimanifer]GGI82821.1 hydrolase [Polymorphobacter multimanifer]
MELDRRRFLAATLASSLMPEMLQAAEAVTVPLYAAVAMQLRAESVEAAPDRAAARAAMLAQIDRVGAQILQAKIFIEQYGGSPLKLAVLPEYLFTSYPGRIGIEAFADKAAIAEGGPEYTALGALAQRLKLHLAGNAYETDTHFPGLYFQTSFIIGPSGDVVLRYRRLNSMYAVTPHDLWDRYLDIYGLDGVFPVAVTEIGRLAAIASEEILYPEIARAHALRGAEVFVHCSSEIGSPMLTHKAIARRARAFENLAYVVSANTAGIGGTAMPLASADGNSALIDWKGNVLAESNAGETFTAFADIDITGLRRARRKPGMTNYLSRQRLELFAAAYAGSVQPANTLIENGAVKTPDRDHFARTQAAVIEKLAKAGII